VGNVASNSARHVAVGPDGTVFMSDPFGGLLAYDHSDTSFTNLRQIVFLAVRRSVKEYTYDDTSLTKIEEVSLDPAFPQNTAIGPDGIVFVASQGGGVSAYLFMDSVFTFLDQVTDPSTADGIAVGPDSIIYVAARDDGYYAFSFYDDSTFTMLDHINVIQANNVGVSPTGVIYFTNGNIGGLLAYTFNGVSFDSVTNWTDPLGALDVAVTTDDKIFLANSLDGLRAFSFDGSTLTNTAHFNPGHNTRDVAISPDGVIYTADDGAGWNAFTYEAATGINNNELISPSSFNLFQNYPNPFNPTTKINFQIPQRGFISLKIYDVLGNEIATLVNEEKPAGSYEVDFEATDFPSGVYFYQINVGSFIQIEKMVLLK
jgi:hypothetical protein